MTSTGATLGTTCNMYGGRQVRNPADIIYVKGTPSSNIHGYKIGTIAVQPGVSAWMLTNLASGTATWTLIASGSGAVEQVTLTGSADTGGPVAPVAGNINFAGGTGIVLSGSGSTVTINAVGEGEKTVTATVAQQMAPNTSYFVPQQALTTLTLPLNASCNLGDVVQVYGVSTNFFTIAQNASQQMNMVNVSTTAGVTGSFTSKETFDSITLKYCGVISTVGQWVVTEMSGTYTKA